MRSNRRNQKADGFLLIPRMLCLAGVLACGSASAQYNGAFGNRNVGGGISGGGFGQGGLGGGGLTGSSFGNIGFSGGGGFTNSGFGTSGFGQTALGQSGFIGGDAQSFFSGLSGASGNNRTGNQLGNFGGFNNLQRNRQANNNRNNNNTRQGSNASRPLLRRRLAVAFDYPPRQSASINRDLTRRINRIATRGTSQTARMAGVTVQSLGSVVVLRGTVATEEDRQLAEQMVRLEPGVWEVQNELALASETAANADSGPPLMPEPSER